MPTSTLWKVLDALKSAAAANVTDEVVETLHGCLNALYAYTFDATPPGESSQFYAGHDHATLGPPINRSLVYSEDSGETALALLQPTIANYMQERRIDADSSTRALDAMFLYEVSPSLPSGSHLEAYVLVKTQGSGYTMLFEEAVAPASKLGVDRTSVDETGDANPPAWIHVPYVPCTPGTLNRLNIRARPKNYQADTSNYIAVYSVVIFESTESALLSDYDASQPLRLGRGGSSSRVYKWFSVLENALADSDYWLDALLLFREYSYLNALFEGLTNLSAPAASSKTVRGHDHVPTSGGWGGYGGRACPRGTMLSGGRLRLTWWLCSLQVASTWTRATNAQTSGTRPTQDLLAPVSSGFASSGSPPTATPYMQAYVYVKWSIGAGTPSLDVRIRNNTAAGSLSLVTAITAGAGSGEGWFLIDKIPCSGDQWNSFDVEFRSNLSGVASPPGLDVYTYALVLIEPASGMVVASAGSWKLGGSS